MNKFDLHSAKFISIIIGICFIFIIVVWHAYDYLPKSETNKSIQSATKEYFDEHRDIREDREEDDNKDLRQESRTIDIEENRGFIKSEENYGKKKIEPLEPITEDEILNRENSNNSENEIVNIINKAIEAKNNENYSEAVTTLQQALGKTDDDDIKADCYEEIAKIYATTKRYGSALSAIQRAYNLHPTTSREVLLARLYYKTGEVEKANDRMTKILKRDFLVNDK